MDLIVTDAAVIAVTAGGLRLEETAPGWTADDVQAITDVNLIHSPSLREMSFGRLSGQAPGKVFPSADAALADVHDGAIVMLDGFAGPGGMAQHLIVALRDQGAKGLTMISNTAGIARVTSLARLPATGPSTTACWWTTDRYTRPSHHSQCRPRPDDPRLSSWHTSEERPSWSCRLRELWPSESGPAATA